MQAEVAELFAIPAVTTCWELSGAVDGPALQPKADVRHATKLSNFVAQLCWGTKLPV